MQTGKIDVWNKIKARQAEMDLADAKEISALKRAEKAAKEKADLEAKIQEQKDAEAKAFKEQQEAELKAKKEAEKLAKAPVKQQLLFWIDSFNHKLPPIENETICNSILLKFQGFKDWAKSEIEKI